MADNGIGTSHQANTALIQASNLECKNLYDYLRTRPSTLLDRLYNHPAICLAVYRCAPLTYWWFMIILHMFILESYQKLLVNMLLGFYLLNNQSLKQSLLLGVIRVIPSMCRI